jgi:hypothetical protein
MGAQQEKVVSGKHVVVARDADGKLEVVGPVYSDKAAREALLPLAEKKGLTIEGIARIRSKAELTDS